MVNICVCPDWLCKLNAMRGLTRGELHLSLINYLLFFEMRTRWTFRAWRGLWCGRTVGSTRRWNQVHPIMPTNSTIKRIVHSSDTFEVFLIYSICPNTNTWTLSVLKTYINCSIVQTPEVTFVNVTSKSTNQNVCTLWQVRQIRQVRQIS